MPDIDPPADYDGTPRRHLLAANTPVWRLHPVSRSPFEFAESTEGDRFPGRAHRGADEPRGLVAEILLRSLPPTDRFRTLPRVRVKGRRMTALATEDELELLTLCDATDLAAVGQTHWLITTTDCDSERMRRWTDWLRDRAPEAAGFIWPARRAPQDRLVVLFEDRVLRDKVFQPDPLVSVDLETEFGALWLNTLLVHHGYRVSPPRTRPAQR
ncbi:hypothetical protein [Actinokineospora sp. NBRC 105648]|uniref:hypothetical protein n=1 Tax=Actinokineospora sp. NBRC 105648 TaxID=3032206 RepID=UPI0024A2B4D7|nr:hypothetical protein [Actinokineospora sp. NBRC 105648]GLZ42324.1 hypothetical protein Acsp05_59480 [Actinokineospora sp. NBRC 105648]